jgi:hypothetical protein
MIRCIDRDYEAASGDVLDGDIEPVFVMRRATGSDVLKLHLVQRDRLLSCELLEAEHGFGLDDVVALFVRTYLGTLTDDYYRGRVDEVEIVPAAGGPSARFPYPSRDTLFG